MEQIYHSIAKELGYNQLVCDIFLNWENVKDELLLQDRKAGSGNGTIHVFLGAADSLLREEFPAYYEAVEDGEDPSVQAVRVKHYFFLSNIISMTGYVGQYYYQHNRDFTVPIRNILSSLENYSDEAGLVSTHSLFKLSIGASKLRPYFKQFESEGVFTKVIRQVLLPESSYKISLFKDSEGEYAAFWLIGFAGQSEFESDSSSKHFEKLSIEPERIISNSSLQLIYYGAPGTGKSHAIKEQTAGEEVIRTTFHPDSDYSTFVGAYKPTSIEVPVRDVTGKVIVENGRKVTENRIVYEFVQQAFLKAYVSAWQMLSQAQAEGGEPKRQYLVIEEINRGNCAQIFGDLFQLLDRGADGFSEYPIAADSDLQKQLKKAFEGIEDVAVPAVGGMSAEDVAAKVLNGELLLLPSNLYIWAAMNTSDQSLFPIDSAFKRRWDWSYVPISEGRTAEGNSLGWVIEVGGKEYDWWQFLERINKEIGEQTRSEDKKLGYFFCKAENGKISAETFVAKVVFYLWNDVFKDLDAGSVFADVDGEELTFNKFYDVDAHGKTTVREDKVELLLAQNLELTPIGAGTGMAAEVE